MLIKYLILLNGHNILCLIMLVSLSDYLGALRGLDITESDFRTAIYWCAYRNLSEILPATWHRRRFNRMLRQCDVINPLLECEAKVETAQRPSHGTFHEIRANASIHK